MDPRARILDLARAEGFDLVRIASAGPILAARTAAQDARIEGRLDGLRWMTEEWIDRATDPGRFLEGAQSVVVLALACHLPDPERPVGPARGRVARYARGRDYHRVFEKKLRRIARTIRDELDANARPTVDYGPLLERPLAAASGMGWLGKSTMLLVPGVGPWVLLGAIATTLELAPDAPIAKTCGTCTRCISACPTGAISPGGHLVDARRCISYHTIENRGPIPRDLRPLFGDWVFGCDACLDSCPVGVRTPGGHDEFAPPSPGEAFPELEGLLALDAASFEERFRGRAIMRAKRDGLARNAAIALGNTGSLADLPVLETALADASPLVRGHVAWALGHLIERLRPSPDILPDVVASLEKARANEHDEWVREELDLALATIAGAYA